MKIALDEQKPCILAEVDIGGCFRISRQTGDWREGALFLKTNQVNQEYHYVVCIDLEKGWAADIQLTETIFPVLAQVVSCNEKKGEK